MTAMSEDGLDLALFDPFTSAGQRASGALLAAARAQQPVFHSPVLQAWVVTRYDDVVAALRAPEVFSSAEVLGPPAEEKVRARLAGRVPGGATLIGWDDPEHRRMRRVLQPAFASPRLRAMRPRIRERTERRLAGLDDQTVVDVRTEIALPLTLEIVFDLIDMPESLRADCEMWSQDWNRLVQAALEGLDLDTQLDLADSAVRLHGVVEDLIAQRRRRPGDDLISEVLAVQQTAEEPLDDAELLSLFPGLIFAGQETTASLLVHAVDVALDRGVGPELAADEDAAARFLEEVARLRSPVAGMARVATRPTTLGGTAIAAGDRLFLHFGSANLDAEQFPDPGRLDTTRPPHHLAFGRGPHACVGAALGRAEALDAFMLIFGRWPGLGRAGTPAPAPHYFLNVLDQLLVHPVP